MKVEVNCQWNQSKTKQTLYKEIPTPNQQTLQQKQSEILQKPNLRIFCSDCQMDIALSYMIITKNDYYCIRCFAMLQDFPQEYLVRKAIKGSFTHSNWDIFDQVVLITAFKLWGFGNWTQIKEYLDYNGSPFPLKDIQAHFQKFYLNQVDDLPPFGEVTTTRSKYTFAELNQDNYSILHNKNFDMKRRDSKGEKKPIPSFRSLSLISSSKEIDNQNPIKNQQIIQQPQIQPQNLLRKQKRNQCSILGYNIKRKQFQLGQYDYTAQNMLSQLQFYETDTPQQHQLKIKIIQSYNKRLEQRLKRRSFVIQYKLLDSDYQFNQQCKLDKQAIQFQSFMRFTNNHQEYRFLVEKYSQSKKYQKFVTNLRRVREKVSKEGVIEDSYKYMSQKRQKYIDKWEKAYNKKYKTKKRNVLILQKEDTGRNLFLNQDGDEVNVQMIDDPSEIYHKAVKKENQIIRLGNLKIKSVYIANAIADREVSPQ